MPAENNLAELDLRPTVIAHKVSFGSLPDAVTHFTNVLEQLSKDITLSPSCSIKIFPHLKRRDSPEAIWKIIRGVALF